MNSPSLSKSGQAQPPGGQSSPVAPGQRQPLRRQIGRFPVTHVLMGMTVLVFVGQWFSLQFFGQDWLLIYGAKLNPAIASGELWRLITPLFLHIGLWHIFVNMYSLYALGPPVERFFGPQRFLAFYLLAGMSGIAFSLAFSSRPSVGASGAIFGLLGSLVAFLYRHRALFGSGGMLQFRHLVVVALLNLGLGLAPGIDNWGHVGGLVGGLALTWYLGPRLELVELSPAQVHFLDRRPWRSLKRAMLAAAGLILSLALLAAFR